MIYEAKHPDWKEEDIISIDEIRCQLNSLYKLWLKSNRKDVYEPIINFYEKELDDSISDFKTNHPETSQVSFTESVARLGETWGKTRTGDYIAT